MPPVPEDHRAKLDVLAGNLIAAAGTDALLALIEAVAEQVGVSEVDGLPIRAWHHHEQTQLLDAASAVFKDEDPEFAAVLQARREAADQEAHRLAGRL